VSLSTCVVIPSYNHERFIGEAVESVLSQSSRPDQVVVIDDGSTDRSLEVLRRFDPADVAVRSEENCGAHAAITRGIDETSADLVFILNSDDRFHPTRVRRFVELFESRPNLALAGSWLDVIDERGRTLDLKKAWKNLEPWPVADRGLTFLATEDARGNLLQGNYLASTSNFVFRRATWQRHRPFRPLRYAHDWDFALRVACREEIAVLPEPLVAYRVHRHNTIRENQLAMEFEVMWVVAAHLRDFLAGSPAAGSDGAARQELLSRTLNSVQTFGRDRLFWLMVALANRGAEGADEFLALLDPANPTRQWLAREMQ
jgi:glycosyltransferase involved in cell wall biosynthesis